MPEYVISQSSADYFANYEVGGFEITNHHFGGAGNYTNDPEFAFGEAYQDKYVELLQTMNISNLRFPGGTTTEVEFANEAFVTGEWLSTNTNASDPRLHLDEFFELASEIDASVTIVLPTGVAFVDSAGDAMLNGTYGGRDRSDISQDYWDNLEAFVDEIVQQADDNGVELGTIEIGNEFWGGAQMSATEYGELAGQVAIWLHDKLQSEGLTDVKIAVQGVSSANEFSPRIGNDSEFWILTIDGTDVDGAAFSNKDRENVIDAALDAANVKDAFGNNVDFDDLVEGEHYEVVDLEDLASYKDGITSYNANEGNPNGNPFGQLLHIAAGLTSAVNDDGVAASDLIDGIISHNYFSGGFGINSGDPELDGQANRALTTIFDAFSLALGRDDLESYATEWSARINNHDGLESIQTNVDAFFELVSLGVDQANFWPLTFVEDLKTRVLIDTNEQDLTFNGVGLQLLSESIIGLSARFDFEDFGDIDVHGFGDDKRLVIFAGDRTTTDRNGVEIDLDTFALSHDYFIAATQVIYVNESGVGPGYEDRHADPDLIYSNGQIVSLNDPNSSIVTFDLDAHGTTRIEMTAITEGNDTIIGRDGNDNIEGRGGSDILYGGDGGDELFGGDSNDSLFGGTGNDTLDGGSGNDIIYGGTDDDLLLGGTGNDKITAGSGDDEVYGGSGKDSISGREGDDLIYGGADRDRLYGREGDDSIFGENGSDIISGSSGNDHLFGGNGKDTINGGSEADQLYGNGGTDTFEFRTGDLVDADGLTGTSAERSMQLDIIHDFVLGADTIEFDNYANVDSRADLKAWATTIDGNLYFTVKVKATNERLLVDVADDTTWSDFFGQTNFDDNFSIV